MGKGVLIKPIISEKSEKLSDGQAKYSFVVAKGANKIEIRDAVESMYTVKVAKVNTMIMPSKAKVRNTRAGVLSGRVPGFKKAIITLVEGEELDFFGEI